MKPTTCSIRASALVIGSFFASTFASTAFAQSDATAEMLFRDGKRLLTAKQYDEACPKFAESARLAPSSGVQLALGLCYEAQGRTASAWGAYTAVVPLARRDSRHDREKAAITHAAALESKVARVTFDVDPSTAALAGLDLRVDGVPLGSVAWTDAPMDAGLRHVTVQAPGRVTYDARFTVDDGGKQTVHVPPLTPVATGDAASHAAATSPFPWKTAAIATGTTGAVAVAAGAILGSIALGKVSDAQKTCPQTACRSASAVSENASGATFADASTGLFVVGGALVATGVLAFLLAPSSGTAGAARPSDAPAGQPVLGLRYVGWRGTF